MTGGSERAAAAAYAAGLANLPGMSPANLVSLFRQYAPEEAWHAVRAGHVCRPGTRPGDEPLPGLDSQDQRSGRSRVPWAEVAGHSDVPGWWAACRSRGIEVTWWGEKQYPAALLSDPEPPGVVFWKGRLECLERPCVALVGTRQATPDGRSVAFELGRDLAAAGVCVVSGLALGIDAAAHAGALDAAAVAETAAGTVGVAASGVDVVYPRQHHNLWRRVATSGAVISETPPGRPAQAWRFPARNRIIAGLVRMVVVVESHRAGGSLLTADAALERGVEVRAVPGSVHSPASAGSNQLLYDGPGPVRHAQDILDGLGDFRSPTVREPARPAPPAPSQDRDERDASLLDAIGWRPSSLAHVVERTGLSVGWVTRRLEELEEAGEVTAGPGWWVRRGAPKASR